jgi:hypothetical protein
MPLKLNMGFNLNLKNEQEIYFNSMFVLGVQHSFCPSDNACFSGDF